MNNSKSKKCNSSSSVEVVEEAIAKARLRQDER